jgi:manganese transport protein
LNFDFFEIFQKAEVLGTAIGLKILFGLPLIWGAVITVFDTLLLMVLQLLGHRSIEMLVFFMVRIYIH